MKGDSSGPLSLAQLSMHPMSNFRASSCSSGYFTESNNVTHESLNFEHIKCVLLGDGAVGKTSLIISYTTNGYPSDYTPTTFDTFKVDVRVEDKPVHLEICDTAGQEDFDALRPLCYPQADAFVLCFSVVSPSSFANIKHKWFPEIRRYGPPSVPIILVGTQSDLRDDVKISIDLANAGEKAVTEAQASELTKYINAVSYIECSALTAKNLKTVFDTALLAAMEYQAERECHGRAHHSKQHSSLVAGSRYSTTTTKKRSQSTSSSAVTSSAAATDARPDSLVGVKLSSSTSCTSPPFIITSSNLKMEMATPKTNRTLTLAKANGEQGDRVTTKGSLPSSPVQNQERHKFRTICCACF